MTNENDIIDDMKTRDRLAAHLEVLDKVKKIPYFPEELFVGISQASYYYETSPAAIRVILIKNIEEFSEDGVRSISGDELKKYQDISVSKKIYDSNGHVFIGSKCRKYIIIPKRALLRIGMILKKSTVAKQVRDYLLDIEERTSVKIKKNTESKAPIILNETYEEISPINIDQEINNINLKTIEKINNNKLLLDNINTHISICLSYGIDLNDASLLIQECVINKKPIDEAIYNKLLNLNAEKLAKQKGVLKQRIKYLAENYYNNNYNGTYKEIINRLKYIIGKDLSAEKKVNNDNDSYIDKIMKYNAYNETLDIVSKIMDELDGQGISKSVFDSATIKPAEIFSSKNKEIEPF